jgi:hypothetical protein
MAANLGMLGFSETVALALHGAFAVAAVAAMIWCSIRCKDRFLQYAVFVICCFVATPYLMAYDTVILCWLALMLIARFGVTPWQGVTFRLLIGLIPIGMVMSMLGIPGYSLILVALFAWALEKAGMFAQQAKPHPV